MNIELIIVSVVSLCNLNYYSVFKAQAGMECT